MEERPSREEPLVVCLLAISLSICEEWFGLSSQPGGELWRASPEGGETYHPYLLRPQSSGETCPGLGCGRDHDQPLYNETNPFPTPPAAIGLLPTGPLPQFQSLRQLLKGPDPHQVTLCRVT